MKSVLSFGECRGRILPRLFRGRTCPGSTMRRTSPPSKRSENVMSLIETHEVTRVYEMGPTRVTALERVTMGANEGEYVAIQGTSGSGKSTLLNLLGGLDRPTIGEVLFDGKSLGPLTKKQMARYRRFSVGMIFQNFNLIPTMTAAENVRLALAFGGLRGVDRKTRALANRPQVLLADEPTGNLDSTRAHELLALLREMVDRDRLTVLLVTHDRELAASFADRIVLMKDGKVMD